MSPLRTLEAISAEDRPASPSIVLEEADARDGERVYVVRVSGDFTRTEVAERFHASLQPKPGLPHTHGWNAEVSVRLGSPCRECECDGQVSRIVVSGV